MMTSTYYWDSRYEAGHTSGQGSYGLELDRRLTLLSNIEYPQTVVDVGCGDFNFGSHLLQLFPESKYLGLDISKYIVAVNSKKYPTVQFQVRSEIDSIPSADLILCLDVLFHIHDDVNAELMLHLMDVAWTKYLALTAYEYDGLRKNHVFIRKFHPAFFGTPLVRQIIEEDGSKYFYLFKR